jgi:hypothetical protein
VKCLLLVPCVLWESQWKLARCLVFPSCFLHKPELSVKGLLLLSCWCLAWFILWPCRLEATCHFETSFDFQQPTRHYIAEDNPLKRYCFAWPTQFICIGQRTVTSQILVESKGFWRWCNTESGFWTLSIVRNSKYKKTQRFGNWFCSRPRVRERKTPTLSCFVEGASPVIDVSFL